MQTYMIATSIDITPSGVRHKSNDPDWLLKRNQQRNYDTLLQVIGLRCQPLNPEVQILSKVSYGDAELAKAWVLTFQTDRNEVLGKDGELFLQDVHGVPIVPGLTETTPSFPPQFISRGSLKNISISSEGIE